MNKPPTTRTKLEQALSSQVVQLLEGCFSANNWCMFMFPLTKVAEIEEVALLCFLSWWAKRFKRDENGFAWFFCTAKTIREHLSLNDRRQNRLFKKLRDRKWIITRFMAGSVPPKREIWIRWDVIGAELIAAQQQAENTALNVVADDEN